MIIEASIFWELVHMGKKQILKLQRVLLDKKSYLVVRAKPEPTMPVTTNPVMFPSFNHGGAVGGGAAGGGARALPPVPDRVELVCNFTVRVFHPTKQCIEWRGLAELPPALKTLTQALVPVAAPSSS